MKKLFLSKTKSQIARHNTIRDINRQVVLNYVRMRSPISRADLARETSLQRSTISAIVDDLQAAGLIEEIGVGTSTGGRKPTLLRLAAGIPAAIGVDITPRETTVVLADLTGNFLETNSFPTSSDLDYMNRQIVENVKALTDRFPGRELEVGISIPGIADQNAGIALYIPYFQWTNWDIGSRITKATGSRVIIDNDANSVALAELWFGTADERKTRNFIVVMVAEGIGTGVVIDGQVYRGESGAAGEFGHMFVADNAPVACSCGRRDCWEAHASEKAIVELYRNTNGNGKKHLDFEHIISLAHNSEPQALKVMKTAAEKVGIGLSNLIIGFSPQAIIVSGTIVQAWDLIEKDLNEMARRSIRQELTETAIFPSALGERPTTLGSISLVLARIFASAN